MSELTSNTRAIIRAALAVAERRLEKLARLRTALERYEGGDAEAYEDVVECARSLCGMETHEEGHRTSSRLV